MFYGFQVALDKHRDHMAEEIESVAKFPSLFTMHLHIKENYNVVWKDISAHMVYGKPEVK